MLSVKFHSGENTSLNVCCYNFSLILTRNCKLSIKHYRSRGASTRYTEITLHSHLKERKNRVSINPKVRHEKHTTHAKNTGFGTPTQANNARLTQTTLLRRARRRETSLQCIPRKDEYNVNVKKREGQQRCCCQRKRTSIPPQPLLRSAQTCNMTARAVSCVNAKQSHPY